MTRCLLDIVVTSRLADATKIGKHAGCGRPQLRCRRADGVLMDDTVADGVVRERPSPL